LHRKLLGKQDKSVSYAYKRLKAQHTEYRAPYMQTALAKQELAELENKLGEAISDPKNVSVPPIDLVDIVMVDYKTNAAQQKYDKAFITVWETLFYGEYFTTQEEAKAKAKMFMKQDAAFIKRNISGAEHANVIIEAIESLGGAK